jgi:hypothetical protein
VAQLADAPDLKSGSYCGFESHLAYHLAMTERLSLGNSPESFESMPAFVKPLMRMSLS